ncbi:hypothetical protein AA14337_0931 [Acetobacter malorum DSM 14337]|uniref:Glycosyl transferase family 2 n=1 Tax=Acetobacter malorum DSM 14337 TaxID=1307910 RepID=A0ABQ0PQD1_9PROT|nr:hypothetical protein [Acetobacter malorum]KXV06888.1 hypothetical protein AD930_06135 [Acetobacter malorum]GBQ77819.1 hypothetical protein AA14337_0931 [Acetobacter malorum DSM 14337]
MKCAAVTYVFNEDINLAIWVNHYGRQFGRENLFIIDSGSTLPPPIDLSGINVIRLPNIPFDDVNKSFALSSLQRTLSRYYDAIVVSDCDEILVANPQKYVDLKDYIQRGLSDYVTAIGLNVVHAIDREGPIDFDKPLLEQRHYAIFNSFEVKTLLTKIPLKWSPGLHYVNVKQKFDHDLFNFHLKLFDYEISMRRHQSNKNNIWNDENEMKNSHHHTPNNVFFNSTFKPVIDMLSQNIIDDFNFDEKIKKLTDSIKAEKIINLDKSIKNSNEDFYCFDRQEYQFVRIPDFFCNAIDFPKEISG